MLLSIASCATSLWLVNQRGFCGACIRFMTNASQLMRPIDVRSPSPGAPDGISGESEIVVEHSPEISVSVERDQVPPATSVQSGIATEPSVNPEVRFIPSVSVLCQCCFSVVSMSFQFSSGGVYADVPMDNLDWCCRCCNDSLCLLAL